MDFKTLFCASIVFQNIYFTNSSESGNVIGPETCILKNKSRTTDADELKKQYISERGFGIRHIWRAWREDRTYYDLNELNVNQLIQVCRCFAGVYYKVNTDTKLVPGVNKDFQYATEPLPLSWFAKEYVEGVIRCTFQYIKTFYLVASPKYYTELHHLNLYVFELNGIQSLQIEKRENPEKFVVKYPNGRFKALYPKINFTEYFDKRKQSDEVIIISSN